MPVLIGLRNILRKQNLYDTGRGPLDKPDVNDHPRYLTARTLDGTFNNLDDPLMGSLGSRFGRNVPLEHTVREKDPLEPNPRTVSRELLTRKEFIPATTLNLLAGAWIQFEVHDWFSHGKNEEQNPWVVPVADDDPWPEKPMKIERTRRDPSADPDGPPTFVTDDTHWWDASQIYGREPAFAAAIRSGEHGKLKIDERGLIPDDYTFRSLDDDRVLQERTLPEVGVMHVRERLTEMSMADALYSFGVSHPGAITLHNFPRFLQNFDKADGTHVDLASIDVL